MHELHSRTVHGTFSAAPQNLRQPILYGGCPGFGIRDDEMIKYGMPGVWTHASWICDRQVISDSCPRTTNLISAMYETFGNAGANTMKRKVDSGESTGGGRISPTVSGTGQCRHTK